MSLLASIAAALNPVKHITDAIAKVMIAKEQENTKEGKLKLDAELATLNAQLQVHLDNEPNRLADLIRALFALPVIFLLWKYLVFDLIFAKWLGWSTAFPAPEVWAICAEIIMFYFLSRLKWFR